MMNAIITRNIELRAANQAACQSVAAAYGIPHQAESLAHTICQHTRTPSQQAVWMRRIAQWYQRATTRELRRGDRVLVCWEVWNRPRCLAVREAVVVRVQDDIVVLNVNGVIRLAERGRVRAR